MKTCNGEQYDDTLDERDEDGPEDDECWDCGGDGYILAYCGEDSCCCAEPDMDHDLIMCRTCRGKG